MGARFLAVDLGATSGRVMLGTWEEGRLALRELRRFPNGPVSVRGALHWDVLRLWEEIRTGLSGAGPLDGVGVDSWGIDFALLDEAGELLGNPHHYRDRRTSGMPEEVDRHVPPERLYERTGIQRLAFNTLYQLFSMRRAGDRRLEAARTLLLIPDLFHYWMSGRRQAEYTNASTTQLCDVTTRGWASDLVEELGLPTRILPPIRPPGTILGPLSAEVAGGAGLGSSVPVIAGATHDTASAVAAVPGLDEHSAFVSSGTWNLVGGEAGAPIRGEQARRRDFTNEGGVEGTVRFLKNVTGLWLVEECRRRWQLEGRTHDVAGLVARAEQAPPLRSIVDPDAEDFARPGDLPAAIRRHCRDHGEPEPRDEGEVIRCCLESLALKHRLVVDGLEEVTGRQIDTLRVVGGGSRNRLLCRLIADACGRRVVAGPAEATALGNVLVQAVATGHLPDVGAGREVIARSVRQEVYEPSGTAGWDAALRRLGAQLTR
ncbi:MAG: rhamnulokinase [Candidatus Dormibacteraeota bacterium]|nr:rhamnulokinase [Candidatus Dormibacteraeota bacterium]